MRSREEWALVPAKKKKRLLIIGGGLIGCETAIYLAEKGHQVTVISRRNDNDIMAEMNYHNRDMALRMMEDNKVQVLTNVHVVQFIAGGISYKQGDKERLVFLDTLGQMSNRFNAEIHAYVFKGKLSDLYI